MIAWRARWILGQLMGKDEIPDDGSGPGEVQITIVVVPGRARSTLTKLRVGARVRTGLVSGGVIAAVAAGAVIAVSAGGGRASRPPAPDALATQFGHRSNCARVTVTSSAGVYARVDLDRAGPCGTFANQGTLILHRLHGAWVREFEASSWRCPAGRLPQRIALELHLCR